MESCRLGSGSRRIRPSRRRKTVEVFGVGAVQVDSFLNQRAPLIYEDLSIGQVCWRASREIKKNCALGIYLDYHLIQDAKLGAGIFMAQAGPLVPIRRSCVREDGKEEGQELPHMRLTPNLAGFIPKHLERKSCCFCNSWRLCFAGYSISFE